MSFLSGILKKNKSNAATDGSHGGQRNQALDGNQRERSPRVVLITGAASGLGLELAKNYLALGERVILTDLAPTAPSSVAGLEGNWEYHQLDVTKEEDWQAVSAEVPALDILISNAGMAIGGRITETSMETWQRAIDINLLGGVRALQTFVPKMNRGGRVVFTGSSAGLVQPPVMAAYNATKSAVVGLAEGLDAELRYRKISVSVLCPGFFKSNLASSLTGDDAHADQIARTLLEKTFLTAEVVARRSVKGIEKRRVIITPDFFSAFTWYAKRFNRVPTLVITRVIGGYVGRRA